MRARHILLLASMTALLTGCPSSPGLLPPLDPEVELVLSTDVLAARPGSRVGPVTVTVASSRPLAAPVPLSLVGADGSLPAGITATFAPAVAQEASSLTIDVGPATAAGEYALRVAGIYEERPRFSAPLRLTVRNAPVIEQLRATPDPGVQAQPIELGWSVSHPDDEPTTCALDVDTDGTYEYGPYDCASGSERHTYRVSGLHTATLVAEDAKGERAETAVTITVVSAAFEVAASADAPDALPGDGVCAAASGECTLRAAVMEANALPGLQTVALPSGRYVLTRAGGDEDGCATGDLDVTEEVIIVGAGSAQTSVEASPVLYDRVLHVIGGAAVRVSGLTVRGGAGVSEGGGILATAPLELRDVVVVANQADVGGGIAASAPLALLDCSVTGNEAHGRDYAGGGGIRMTSSSLTMRSSVVSGNTATASGGGIQSAFGAVSITDSTIADNLARGFFGKGGGVSCDNADATLKNVNVTGNRADDDGGGLSSLGVATATLDGSRLERNTAGYRGGAIFHSGTAVVTDTTLSANGAAIGGGLSTVGEGSTSVSGSRFSGNSGTAVVIAGGTLAVANSTLSGNTGVSGGALRVEDGTVTLTNATLSGNVASSSGGGAHVATGAAITGSFVTIAKNSAPFGGGIFSAGAARPKRLKASILGQNSGEYGPDCSGPVLSAGHNVVERGAGCTLSNQQVSDVIGADPELGPLANNGGHVDTHALSGASPARDSVPVAECTDAAGVPVPTDSRGVARPGGGDCDAGAFESE